MRESWFILFALSATAWPQGLPIQNSGFETRSLPPWQNTLEYDSLAEGSPTVVSEVANSYGSHSGSYEFVVRGSFQPRTPKIGQCLDSHLYISNVLFQTVDLPAVVNGEIIFGIWVRGYVQSDVTLLRSDVRSRIGIDPTGGSDPKSNYVIWGDWSSMQDAWAFRNLAATVSSTNRVTVFVQERSEVEVRQCLPLRMQQISSRLVIDDAVLGTSRPKVAIVFPTEGSPLIRPLGVTIDVSDAVPGPLTSCKVLLDGVAIRTISPCNQGRINVSDLRVSYGIHQLSVRATNSWNMVEEAVPIRIEVIPEIPIFAQPAGAATTIQTLANGDLAVAGLVSGQIQVSLLDSQLRPRWTRSGYGSLDSESVPIGIVADKAGNLILAGSTRIGSSKDRNVFVQKYGPNGNLVWQRAYTTGTDTFLDYARRLAVDGEGAVYVVLEGRATYGKQAIFVLKYSPAGELLWSFEYGPDPDWQYYATAATVDDQGRCYVAGDKYWYKSGDGSSTLPILLRLGPDGALDWQRSDSGRWGQATVFGLGLDPAGNAVTATTSMLPDGRTELFVIKYGPGGEPIWQKNGIYLAGTPLMNLDGKGNIYLSNLDYWLQFLQVMKIDENGNIVWQVQKGFAGRSLVSSGVDADGNLYDLGLLSGNPYLFYAQAWKPDGGQLWYRTNDGFTGSGGDLMALSVSPQGNVYFAGDSGGLYVGGFVRGPRLFGAIELQSFNGNPQAIPFSLRGDSQGSTTEIVVGALSPLGNYVVSLTEPSTYDLFLKSNHWLTTKTTDQTLNGVMRLDWISGPNGDAVENDVVHIADLSFTFTRFGTADADLDGSGLADLRDINIVMVNFGLEGDR